MSIGGALQGRVLLLNGRTWEPLSVVTIPRAINLLLSEKAVVVEQTDQFLRTVRDRFPIPSVIALRTYVKRPTQASALEPARGCWYATASPAFTAA